MLRREPASAEVSLGASGLDKPIVPTEVPLFIRFEREMEDKFRPLMLQELQRKVDELADSQRGHRPTCTECDQPMQYKDETPLSWLTRFGKVTAKATLFLCKPCETKRRPVLEMLGVEPGQVSGSLARLLALLGVIVPYELAAQLALMFYGVQVNAMTVWRSVQRLGEAVEQYTNALSEYHANINNDDPPPLDAPDAIVLGVDGCALGMQVRENRRRRKTAEEKLGPLPEVEDGHFREVKTGVLLLPAERVTPSPGRRSVLRRVLVTYLGNADTIFDRLWAKLQELRWLGPNTVVVIVGDGAEWIWNRATMFPRRCEILDFWHAIECAWKFARLQHGEGSKIADKWTHRIAKKLRDGKIEQVIAHLNTLSGTTEKAQEKLEDLIRYYTNNQHRMHYKEYLRLGYGIGSGAVESAHKQVVHARLRQAGMRWSVAGAQRLLALRLLLLNGEWAFLDRLRMVSLAKHAA